MRKGSIMSVLRTGNDDSYFDEANFSKMKVSVGCLTSKTGAIAPHFDKV